MSLKLMITSKKDHSTWIATGITPGSSLFTVKCISTGKTARVTKNELLKFFKLDKVNQNKLDVAIETYKSSSARLPVGGDDDDGEDFEGEPLRCGDASDGDNQGEGGQG